jgi:6-phosphogluconolactonase
VLQNDVLVNRFDVEVFPAGNFPQAAAALVTSRLPRAGTVVLTGGTTAESVYPHMAAARPDWSGLTVLFSDERSVPPDDAASNYRMAVTTLAAPFGTAAVRRIKGEDEPGAAADEYEAIVASLVDKGIRVGVLGLGEDGHIAAMFPGSSAIAERARLCVAVRRPDGLGGVTLTAPALLACHEIVLIAAGERKADAVRRALSDEPVESFPVRVLAAHGAVTLLLDEAAAAALP